MKTIKRKQIDVNTFQDLFLAQRRNSHQLRYGSISDRKGKLTSLKNWVENNTVQITLALYKDLKKPKVEALLSEIQPVLSEARHAVLNLHRWMKQEKVSTPLVLLGTNSYTKLESKGVCLIISPWNYPFNLLIIPLISAIAAGNTVILKPSELAPHTAQLIEDMISELFSENEVKVCQGGVEVSKQLLNLPFNHIFFTGSSTIGKVVMKAAAENLTSITLELGGKSPVIIDKTANIKDTAEKLVWGKFINSGQTCIAPDYVYVHSSIFNELEKELKKYIGKQYYKNGKIDESNYTRIISEKHYNRIIALTEDALYNGGKISFGGGNNIEKKIIEPTLITNVQDSSKIMQEEIFGPILLLKTYTDFEVVIKEIASKPTPLALYYFSKSRKRIKKIVNELTTGAICINESILHFINHNLPFGGVNHSGMGKSHGYYGFLAFSNKKAILEQRIGFTPSKLFYPPYSNFIKKLALIVSKYL